MKEGASCLDFVCESAALLACHGSDASLHSLAMLASLASVMGDLCAPLLILP